MQLMIKTQTLAPRTVALQSSSSKARHMWQALLPSIDLSTNKARHIRMCQALLRPAAHGGKRGTECQALQPPIEQLMIRAGHT